MKTMTFAQAIEDALMQGTRRARETASETMQMVRSAMRVSTYTKSWL